MESDNLTIKSLVSDKDIIFQGNDGGSGITALTLDMSAAGAATFNGAVTSKGTLTVGAGGDEFTISESLDNITMAVAQSNKSLTITGNAGGSTISALAFDMENAGNATFNGSVTANAGVVIDNITIDGSEIDLSSGDLTVDVAGDIILDAAGEEVIFKDGSTNVGHVSMDSDNLTIKSLVSDKDIIFQGNDGGSGITALTLDMSAAGAATFNGAVTANAGVNIDNITIDGTEIDLSSGDLTIDVAGDIILDAAGGDFKYNVDGTEILRISNSSSNVVVKPIVDEKDIIFQQYDGNEVARVDDDGKFYVGGTDGVIISQGAIEIKNGGTESYIDFYCESSNAHYTRLQAPAHSAFSGNVTVTLPAASGTVCVAGGTGLTLSSAGSMSVDASQTQITAVGTIATGVWNGTAIESAYLDSDTAHLSVAQTFSALKTFTAGVNITGNLDFSDDNNDIIIKDNSSTALVIKEDTNVYMTFDSTNSTEKIISNKTFQAARGIDVKNSSTSGGYITLYESSSNSGNNFTKIKAADDITTSATYILPANIGSQDQVLKISSISGTEASLAWADETGGGGGGGGGGSTAADDITAGDAAVNITTTSGNITIDSNAGALSLDGHTGVTIASSNSGNITFDSVGDIILDAGDADIQFKDDGTQFLKMSQSGGNCLVFNGATDTDIIFKELGSNNEIMRIDGSAESLVMASGKKLAFVDENEYISSDGTDLTIESGNNILLTPTGSGSVGIGVSDPDRKLEVNGSIHISGEEDLSSVSVTDGDGGLLYVKTDGKLYWKSSEVSETDLTSGGGGGGVSLTGSTNNTICTVTGSNAIAGEANFTYDDSTDIVTLASSSSSDDKPSLVLHNTNSGDGSGPALILSNDSSSINTVIGEIEFKSKNDNSDTVTYAKLHVRNRDDTQNSESSLVLLQQEVAGTTKDTLKLGPAGVNSTTSMIGVKQYINEIVSLSSSSSQINNNGSLFELPPKTVITNIGFFAFQKIVLTGSDNIIISIGTSSGGTDIINNQTIQSSAGTGTGLDGGTGLSLIKGQFAGYSSSYYAYGSSIERLPPNNFSANYSAPLSNLTSSSKYVYIRLSTNSSTNFDQKGIITTGYSGSGGNASNVDLNIYSQPDDTFNNYKIDITAGGSDGNDLTATINDFTGNTRLAQLVSFSNSPSSTSMQNKTFKIYEETGKVMFFMEYMHTCY